jgi:hypothetical protein
MLNTTPLNLPTGVTVEDAADACRDAMRELLAMTPRKDSLSDWLVGPYRQATRFAPRHHGSVSQHPTKRPTGETVAEIVENARAEVCEAITECERATHPEQFVKHLPPVLHVMPVRDYHGHHGFVPVDVARARLVDRVFALVVSDMLTRPQNFFTVVPAWLSRVVAA